MKRITKQEAYKRFCDGDIIVLSPCKFIPDGSFSMGCRISGKEWLEHCAKYENHCTLWEGTLYKTAWSRMMDNWKYYNASYETGYYAHYYID
jgi:hypothetical protein